MMLIHGRKFGLHLGILDLTNMTIEFCNSYVDPEEGILHDVHEYTSPSEYNSNFLFPMPVEPLRTDLVDLRPLVVSIIGLLHWIPADQRHKALLSSPLPVRWSEVDQAQDYFLGTRSYLIC